MIEDNDACRAELAKLRPLVLRLTLVSHAPTQTLNPAPPPDGTPLPRRWRGRETERVDAHAGPRHRSGGDTQTPRGAIDRKGDLTPEFRQKSDAYFTMTLNRWERSKHLYGSKDLAGLVGEAEDALDWWQHTPTVAGVQHERDTFLWKCEIADAFGTAKDVGQKYAVGQRTVERYRSLYRGIRRRAA